MTKKLKIAQIAPLWTSVPPDKYGGIEKIVYHLCQELTRKGHEVVLFASGDSKTKAKLVSVYPKALLKDGIPWTEPLWNLENLARAFSQAEDFDVLHCHLDIWSVFFQETTKTPVLHTFHNPLYTTKIKPGRDLPVRFRIFSRHRKKTNAAFISKSQKKLCPIKFAQEWIVHNGIDASLYKFNPEPKNHFVWVARIDAHKGIENAISAAKKAGVKLLLAGRLDPARKSYFQEKIKPHLGKQISYLGELPPKDLTKFYREAKALLYPIEWHEPFGLVMTEAMACGTPVIAFNLGSVPEVIKDKKTGFVVPFKDKRGRKNIAGIVEAINKIEEVKREDCRAWVEENFSFQKMVARYEKIYEKITSRGTAAD